MIRPFLAESTKLILPLPIQPVASISKKGSAQSMNGLFVSATIVRDRTAHNTAEKPPQTTAINPIKVGSNTISPQNF